MTFEQIMQERHILNLVSSVEVRIARGPANVEDWLAILEQILRVQAYGEWDISVFGLTERVQAFAHQIPVCQHNIVQNLTTGAFEGLYQTVRMYFDGVTGDEQLGWGYDLLRLAAVADALPQPWRYKAFVVVSECLKLVMAKPHAFRSLPYIADFYLEREHPQAIPLLWHTVTVFSQVPK